METTPTASQIAARPKLVIWLCAVLGLLFVMIIVGGLTRLTDSGLSITEWKPVTGAIPPLSEAAWEAELEKYRQIPQYQLINKGMSLDEFKFIYWWEWGHRFLGRLIGLVFFVPFMVFLWRKEIEDRLKPRLWIMLCLGGFQGFIGWWMVASGLTERVSVSQYRLAAHLGVAFFIWGFILWHIFGLTAKAAPRPARSPLYGFAWAVAGLTYIQILLGALVAGLDAGMTYNTWPLMDGRLIPEGMLTADPLWRDFFENITTVQFQHRMVAYVLLAAIIVLWWRLRQAGDDPAARKRAMALMHMCLLQAALGIATLLAVVPVWLAALHQAGAVVLLSLSLWLVHRLRA